MKEEAENEVADATTKPNPEGPEPKEYTDPFLQGYHQVSGCRVTLPHYQVRKFQKCEALIWFDYRSGTHFILQNITTNEVSFRLRNASSDPKHRWFSYLGTPENIWFERTIGTKEEWDPSYGTVIRIELSQYPCAGTEVQLFVNDKDGSPWVMACRQHRRKTKQEYAFVFRDPHTTGKPYPVTVCMNGLITMKD